MMQPYCHSPFSEENVNQAANPALLLQFILNELIQAKDVLVKTSSPFASPFDWKDEVGSFNKVKEHTELLSFAFPSLVKEAEQFRNSLELPCAELILCLKPFILSARDNIYLIYFLMKHKSHPSVLELLSKIPKENIEKMQSVVATKYRKKGLSPPQWMY